MFLSAFNLKWQKLTHLSNHLFSSSRNHSNFSLFLFCEQLSARRAELKFIAHITWRMKQTPLLHKTQNFASYKVAFVSSGSSSPLSFLLCCAFFFFHVFYFFADNNQICEWLCSVLVMIILSRNISMLSHWLLKKLLQAIFNILLMYLYIDMLYI